MIDLQGVICSIKPVKCDVNNPYAVEVNKNLNDQLLLIIGFEEDIIPVYSFKLHELVCRHDIDEVTL